MDAPVEGCRPSRGGGGGLAAVKDRKGRGESSAGERRYAVRGRDLSGGGGVAEPPSAGSPAGLRAGGGQRAPLPGRGRERVLPPRRRRRRRLREGAGPARGGAAPVPPMAPQAAPPRFGPRQLLLAAAGAAAAALDVCADGWVAAEYARGGRPGWAALALALLAVASVATQACSWLWLRSDPPALRPDVPRWLLAGLHLLQLGFLFRYGTTAPPLRSSGTPRGIIPPGTPPAALWCLPPPRPGPSAPPQPPPCPPTLPPHPAPAGRGGWGGDRGPAPCIYRPARGAPWTSRHPCPHSRLSGRPRDSPDRAVWPSPGLEPGRNVSVGATPLPLAEVSRPCPKGSGLLRLPVLSLLPEASCQMEPGWVLDPVGAANTSKPCLSLGFPGCLGKQRGCTVPPLRGEENSINRSISSCLARGV